MTPQPKTDLPNVPRLLKRRIVRRRTGNPVLPAATPPAFVPSHREEERVSPNGTVFRVSVPLGATGQPLTGDEFVAYLRSRPAPDPEVHAAVMRNIEAARQAERDAPDDDEEAEP